MLRTLNILLIHRFALFLALQATLAALFAMLRVAQPWVAAAAWWPVTATATNLLTLWVLLRLGRKEGASYADIISWRGEGHHLGRDLLAVLGVLVLAAPIGFIPNFGLATLLFGDAETAIGLFVRPLPAWAAWVSLIAFPISIALVELPIYYGYIMPRLTAATGARLTRVLGIVAFWHAAQHMTLPLLFDWRFMVWRLLMFLPFALFLGFVIARRPRLLPYLMVVHGLLDLQVAWMVLAASAGM